LNVTRSEAAIADPTQVVVHSISPTFITADSFLDSVEFALSKTNVNTPEVAHGGFSKAAQPSVVVGQARESISGVLPLYICEEHWSVAKHKMKPIMGWVTTLDILGYSASQIRAIPFLALATAATHAIGDAASPFKKSQFDLILQTCAQIYKDFSHEGFDNSLATEVKSLFSQYINNPAIRTVDSIANNYVFLMHLYCGVYLKDIDPIPDNVLDKFFLLMAEEEMRRHQPYFNMTETEIFKLLYEVLAVNENVHIIPIVRAFEETQKPIHQERLKRISEFYDRKLEDLADGKPAVLEEGEETLKDCLTFTPDIRVELAKLETTIQIKESYEGNIDTLVPKAQLVVTDYEKSFIQWVSPLMKLKNLFSNQKDNNLQGFEALGPVQPACILAMIIQNIFHMKNADRRDAIAAGNYLDPYENPQEILKRMYNKIVQIEREKRVRDMLGVMSTEISSLVSSYTSKFRKFIGEKQMRWELDSIKLYYMLRPDKRVFHAITNCDVCHHNKPEWAGFRCRCGCMVCFTSYYFDVKPPTST
jgi:hypothetical protein